MTATRFSEGVITKPTRPLSSSRPSRVRNSVVPIDRKRICNADVVGGCRLLLRHRTCSSPLVTSRRKFRLDICGSQLGSDCDVEQRLAEEEDGALNSAGKDT